MNNSDNGNMDYVGEEIPQGLRILFIILGSCYIILGVSGNCLIIFTIAITKTMRNPHFYFIINLAISDLILTGYVLPWNVSSFILHYYPVPNFNLCIFNGFITVCAYVSSLISLLAISFNRYLCVCHNDLFKRLFSRKILSSVIGCGFIWLISILCTMPCLTGWGRFVFDRKGHYCCYDRTYSFSYTLYLLVVSIGVPVIIIFFCNFAIWRFVRESRRRIHAITKGHQESERSSQSRKGSALMPDAAASTSSAVMDDHKLNQNYDDCQNMNDIHKLQSSAAKFALPKVDNGPHSQRKVRIKSKRKVNSPRITTGELALIKTVFTVFVAFSTLMSPYMISTLVDTQDRWPSALHIACSLSSFTNCCLNCFLYGLMTPRFKEAYRALFSMVTRRTLEITSSDRNPQNAAT